MSHDHALLEVEPLSAEARLAARRRVMAGVESMQRRRRRTTRGAAGIAAAAVVGALGYSALTPESAYASWTTVPLATSLSPGDPRLQECAASMPAGPPESIGSGERLTPVIAEKRGVFTSTLLRNGDSIAFCILDDTSQSSGQTVAPPLPPGDSVSVVGNGGSLDEEEGVRYVYGRVSPVAVEVVVETADGLSVTASVSGGHYLAWWPTAAEPTRVIASSREGTVLQQVLPSEP